MSKIFSKKDINNIILKETKGYYILNKKDLKLNENDNAYVEASGNDMSNMAPDIRDAQTNNPTAKEFVVNLNSYNGKQSDDTVTVNVHAKNSVEGTKKIQQTMASPAVKSILGKTNVNAKLDLNSVDREHFNKLREGSVPFTKKEIREMFKK